MALTALSLIHRAATTLQDIDSVRWPIDELARYFNDAQREVVLYRPDAAITTITHTCVAGTRQTLPASAAKLLDVTRNLAATSAKGAVRLVSREILDAQLPGWHAATPVVDVKHYMYDARDTQVFYVYPPATVLAQLELMYAAFPADIAEPTPGLTYTSVTGNLGLPDIYGNVVVDYILYRAYTKDSEYAGNAQRAAAYYSSFANALGIEITATVNNMPLAAGNPNITTRSGVTAKG